MCRVIVKNICCLFKRSRFRLTCKFPIQIRLKYCNNWLTIRGSWGVGEVKKEVACDLWSSSPLSFGRQEQPKKQMGQLWFFTQQKNHLNLLSWYIRPNSEGQHIKNHMAEKITNKPNISKTVWSKITIMLNLPNISSFCSNINSKPSN